MSEEIRNEEGLSPETEAVADEVAAENVEAISSEEEAVAVAEEAVAEEAVAEEAVAEEAVAEEAVAEEAVAEEAVAEEAVAEEAVAEGAVEEAVAEEAVAEAVAEEEVVDLSHMPWEERVSHYISLGTVKGYCEAIRLVDFHNPGDIQIAEVWGNILQADGEHAREIYDGAKRLITSESEVWNQILEAHKAARDNASDDGQLAIGEVIGWIQCMQTNAADDGKACLANFENARNTRIAENLALVATGNWRKVEQTIEAQVKESLSDENAIAVEAAHQVADYALSAGVLDRAVEMMRRTSRKITDDVSLKWRLAVLSRDQKKWNAYVDVLSKELIQIEERVEGKVDIYNEMIRIYRDETKQENLVVKTYEALLAVDPGNVGALESLIEIYEKLRKWPDLIKVLDAQAEVVSGDSKVDFYLRIAKIYLEKLNRKVDAIKYFENVLSVDSIHQESLELLKGLYTERRDWEKLIDVHRKELGLIPDVPDQIELLKVMADIAKTKLRNNGVSIGIWNQILELDGENAEAIAALEALYEGEKRWADLAGIVERKIGLMGDVNEQFAALQKLGPLYSDKANDNVSAIATWRRVLAIDPSFTKGVDSLRKLLIEERDWESLEAYYAENDILIELVKLFEQLSKTLKDDADKKAVLFRAAHVYENSLGESDKAMATLEKILTIDAKDAQAAKELVEYYEPRGMFDELAKMLEIIFNSCEAGEERSAYGLRLAKLFETKLFNDVSAYEWYLKIVTEDIRYTDAFDGLERTAGKTGHAQVVVDLFRKNLETSEDALFSRELQYRIGCLLLEYLNGADEAMKIFEELLAEDPEDVRALGALERILEREGRFQELYEVNERRMALAKSDADRAETLLSGARIKEHHLENKEGAIENYEQVCELLPEDTRPLIELHRLYAETEAYENLARVIEKQLELMGAGSASIETRSEAELNEEGIASIVYGATLVRSSVENEEGEAVESAVWVDRELRGLDAEAAIALWSELGEVYRTHLSEYDASVACYDNILLLNIEHEGAIAALEELLESGVSVDTICRALSRVYSSKESYDKLASVLVTLSDAVSNSADKISYLVCAAQINNEILSNMDGTLECLHKAMACNPAGELVKSMLLEAAQREYTVTEVVSEENEEGETVEREVETVCNYWSRVIAILEEVSRGVSSDDDAALATQYAIELGSLWETQLDNRAKAIEYGKLALELGGSRTEVIEYLKETFVRLESWEEVIDVLKAESSLTEDDEALLAINMQIASIQEEYLGKNDDAINTLLEVIEKHSENTDAMVSLDRLYAACERWEEAVANYERRLDLLVETEERDVVECEMASILSAHLNEIDRAYEIYSSVLSHDGENALAVQGLEQMIEANEGTIVEQIADLLLPIYDAQDNWERRCWTDEQLLRVVIEPDRRRDLLHEIAMLCEQRGEERERAYDAYARSLKEDLTSQVTIDQLYSYADVLGKWSDLVRVMEEATVDADDVLAAKNIRMMVAEIYREHLSDVDASITTYVSIREQDPEDIVILDALLALYQSKESWKEYAEVLMAKSALVDDPEERKALLFSAASVNEEILGDVDAAIAIHTDILADESGEPNALNCLERLYLGKESWAELLNVYDAKIDNAESDEDRKNLFYVKGELQETRLEDNVGAVETYQQVLSIEPADAIALEALDRLYIAVNDMPSLLEILEKRELIAEDEASCVLFKFRQAECKYRHLDDSLGAIEVYNAVFELDAAHEASIASLEEIIAIGGEAAIEAAKVLVPIYQGLSRWAELVKVYEVLVSGSEDLEELIQLLSTIGTIHEEMLEAPKDAFNAWFRALSQDVTREDSWGKVHVLAETCQCWAELVEKLDGLSTDIASDADAAIIVIKHMAVIQAEKLELPEKSIESYRRILEMDSNDLDAIRGLDSLYEVLQKWEDLADILHTEIDIAETDEERLACYYRLGAVQEMYLENYEDAVNSYNEMHMIVPGQPEAIESLVRIFTAGHNVAAIADILENYYRSVEAWEQLVALDLQFVEHIEDHNERYDKFLEIADVYLNNLGMVAEGLGIYGRALCEIPGDDTCLMKIDELSEIIQDWSNNVVYYRNAVAVCEDDLIKQDLMLRKAQTYDARLEDAANAERCYLAVLGFDPEHLESLVALDRIYAAQQRWEDLVAIMRREIPIVDSDETRISLYMRLGAVLNDMLTRGDEAIAAYEEILNIDPGYWDALVALEAIYQGREDWVSLDSVYDREAAACDDDMQRVALWGKRAQLNSEVLNKVDDAVDLWYQVLDVLGDNLVALQNLEVLFIRTERWADVADVLERQVPLAVEDAELHLETYRKLGRVYRDKLEDNDRSIDFWRNAHEVNPNDLETLRAIEALDEVLDDQYELADTLRKILQTGQLGMEDQLACAIKMAGVLDAQGRVEETIDTWLYVVQLDAHQMHALDELERLYEGEGRWAEVVNTLKSKIAILEELESKVELYLQSARIWEQQVEDIDKAAEEFMNILDLDPERESAFELLEELYTNNEKWQELLSAYLERADVVSDAKKRLELLFKGAVIAEEKLAQPETAFAVLLQYAIPTDWKDEKLHSEIQRLAELTSSWEMLVAQYEEMIEGTTNVADSFTLHNTVARWYFHHLNNNEVSWQHFQHVLSQDPNNMTALASMTEIFWRLGNWEELVNYLLKRLELTTITDDRVSLFLELAKVFEEKIGDLGQAIDCYMQAFKLSEERLDVMKELARIYEAAEQWNELVGILERETAVIEDAEEKIPVRYKIGVILETKIQDAEKAVESYNAVIAMDEAHCDALKALERLNSGLERWNDLLKIYEYQLAAFQAPEEHIDIYEKVSKVYETRLNNLENAISSMIQVTLIDAERISAYAELERLYELAERWQDLIDTLNTHINTLANVQEHVELYRKLGEVYRDKMADAYHAVESYQYLISIEPNDVPALYALADLYENAEDYISAIDYLNRVIGCITDTTEAIQVHLRIGSLYDKHLQDDPAAEERYKICLDIDASFMPAINALREMYIRHEDWQNLVRILKQKVEFTRELDEKAQINCELGDVSLNNIGDKVNAYAYYNEALSLQPDCVNAAWPLAEKCVEDKAYARALLLYEIVINGIAFVGDNSRLYEVNYKAGLCCQNLAQHKRALDFYSASYELNQDYAPTLLGMGEELLEANEYENAYKMFQVLLERFLNELTPEQVILIYHDSAIAKKATGEYELARQLLERILEADGTQTKSLELIIDVCEDMADWEAYVYYMNIHVDRQDDPDLKFTGLLKIAQVYHENLNDYDRQIETYYRALDVDPTSRIVLNELLTIYHSTGQWENAIGIIERLCENEENVDKIAKYYYTIAVIYRDELNYDDKSVEFFNKTLDTNIGELRAFEAIDRILTASRNWEALEENYKLMLNRVIKDGSSAFEDTKKLLWYGLGEIYRTRLNEWDRAIEAFKAASELSPNDQKLHMILSELYIRMPDHTQDAIQEIRTLIELQGENMTPEQEKRNYRSLFFLYYQSNDLDKAWCISDITVAKGICMQDELDHHEDIDDMLAGSLPRLSPEDATNYLYHPTLSGDLTKLFSIVQQAMRPAFAMKEKDAGIAHRKKSKVPYSPDAQFWKIYENAARAFGVNPVPEVFNSQYLSTGMRLANVDFNAFMIAPDMQMGRTISELRFIIARNMFLFQVFFMAGIDLTSVQLKSIIVASLMQVTKRQPQNREQEQLFKVISNIPKALYNEYQRALYNVQNKEMNVSAWLKAVDYTCDRAGLLLSADFATAVKCIRAEDYRVSKLTPDERIRELTKFAMSDEYFTLRSKLNILNYDNAEDFLQG